MFTFKDLQDRALRWIDEGEDVNITRQLVKDAIKASHFRFCTSRQWNFMAWPQKESITTQSGTSIYALNPNINRCYHLWDPTLKQYMPIVARREWPAAGVNRSNIATPPFGVIWGPNWPVRLQPASASVVTAVSTSNSDSSQSVIVKGIDANGDMQTNTLVMTGTVPVNGTTAFVKVTNVTKTGTWIGTLTLSAGATTLLTLPAAEFGRVYPTVEFLEDPPSGRVLEYNFQRHPQTLTEDNDIPETPYPYSELHVYDALLDLTTYNTELGAKEQGLWKARLDELKDAILTAQDEEIVGAYPRFVRDLDDKGIWSRTAVYNP